jgi:FtsP/CotA-like multicopper oxidase with cupredoxin domain
VLAGDVRVEFNNAYAEDPHDLKLMRGSEVHGFDELPAGGVEAKTFRLSAGTWTLFCAVSDHAQRGMSASLKVSSG